MRMIWHATDVEPGILVASKNKTGNKFQLPSVVAFQIGDDGQPVFGLCSLDSGSFMQFNDGSKKALAEKLTEGGYLPVSKLMFEGPVSAGMVDNRLKLPVVTFTRIDITADGGRSTPVF